MKKIISLLLISMTLLSFFGCEKDTEMSDASILPANSVTPTDVETQIPDTNPNASSPTPEATSTPSETPMPTQTVVVGATQKPIATPTTSACTHAVVDIDIGGFWSRYVGIENRAVFCDGCDEDRQVLYVCPVCGQTVVYEVLPPIGHEYADEVTLIRYPTALADGCYGRKCTRDYGQCKGYLVTQVLLKRSGDYSKIDSRFKVYYDADQSEIYRMDSPRITVYDKRTWGSVPSITYKAEENKIIITTVDKTNQPVTYVKEYDQYYVDEGYWIELELLDEGGCRLGYGYITSA